jgi:hypothetical protein
VVLGFVLGWVYAKKVISADPNSGQPTESFSMTLKNYLDYDIKVV